MAAWKRLKNTDEEPPVEPAPPALRQVKMEDTTPEGGVDVLQSNPDVLIAREELSGWLGSFDAYSSKGRASKDSEFWLKLHDGRGGLINRATKQPKYYPASCVCLTGTCQPDVFKAAVKGEHSVNGLLARFLPCLPPRIQKSWTDEGIDPELEDVWAKVIHKIWTLVPATNEQGKDRPLVMKATPEATRIYSQHYNVHNSDAMCIEGPLASAWSKLEETPIRLAIIFQIAWWACGEEKTFPDEINAKSIERGITVAKWFASEAKRVHAMLSEHDEDSILRKLAELIVSIGGTTTPRDLTRNPKKFKSTEEATKALDELVKAGYGEWQTATHTSGKGRPKSVFVITDPPEGETEGVI